MKSGGLFDRGILDVKSRVRGWEAAGGSGGTKVSPRLLGTYAVTDTVQAILTFNYNRKDNYIFSTLLFYRKRPI